MLSITKERFLELYRGTPLERNIDIFYTKPSSLNQLNNLYLPSKLWRLNNLYTVVDKKSKLVKFSMNDSQHFVYSKRFKHPRLIILKSRQRGISTLWMIVAFDNCIFTPHFSCGLMSQGIIESGKLLERVKTLWDELSPLVKNTTKIKLIKDNVGEIAFNNRSKIYIHGSFRSTTLHYLHVSELGKIAKLYPDRVRETMTGSMQAIAPGNSVILESTSEGDNDFKEIWDRAILRLISRKPFRGKDFYPVFLSWIDDPDCVEYIHDTPTQDQINYFSKLEQDLSITLTKEKRNFWISQHDEIGEDIYREYPSTPEEAFYDVEGRSYLAKHYLNLIRKRNREVSDLYDPALPVQVGFDLGKNDSFVMVFIQTFTDGIRFIDEYVNNGEDISFYCGVLKHRANTAGYTYSALLLPHDAAVEDLSVKLTREELFWEYGFRQTTILDKTSSVEADREVMKEKMRDVWVDPDKCPYIISCFLNYGKKWDKIHKVWADSANKDKYIHGADAIRCALLGAETYKTITRRVKRNISFEV